MNFFFLFIFHFSTTLIAASVIKRDVSGASLVHLGDHTGTPNHLASGILYGMPVKEFQIPDNFYTDMGFWNMRSGGAQLPEPARGWTRGYSEFKGRYDSLLADYHTTRRYGGNFQVLLHDLWGTDSWPSADETPTPGDNGSWASFDDFLSTLFNQMIADNMIEGVFFDICNEYDNSLFFNRGLERFLDFWGHAYHRIHTDFPQPRTVGPSFGHLPDFGAFDWYETWTKFIKKNDSVPTQLSMHFLEPNGNLKASIDAFQGFLQEADITYTDPFIVNEYGNIDQQKPSGTAWNIAQLERNNAIGLRANWRGGYELHDYMANLLGKPHTYPDHIPDEATYWPAPEYPVYKYYNLNMTGHRVRTEMTEDTLGDTYATVDNNRVRILSGVRPQTGLWAIVLQCLSCLGLSVSGDLPIQTWRFNGGGLYERRDGPDDLGYYIHSYTDDALLFYIGQDDPEVAYAFEFSI